MGHGSSLVRPRAVTGEGDGLVSHAGLWGWPRLLICPVSRSV